jgi:hypothetical protein
MAHRRRSRRDGGTCRMRRKAKPPEMPWPHLQEFIDNGGQLSIGEIHPVTCAAVAADRDTMYAALVRRDGESLVDLLHRMDLALDKALSDEIFTDEINT